MSFFKELFCCAYVSDDIASMGADEKMAPKADATAKQIVDLLLSADTSVNHDLDRHCSKIVNESGISSCGWSNWRQELAQAMVNALTVALKAKVIMGDAMAKAYSKAKDAVREILHFAEDHPVFCALVALGILAIMFPWAIEWFGFGELGPIADTLAAAWQRTYLGRVPKSSWFSFFQRLGMIWGRQLQLL